MVSGCAVYLMTSSSFLQINQKRLYCSKSRWSWEMGPSRSFEGSERAAEGIPRPGVPRLTWDGQRGFSSTENLGWYRLGHSSLHVGIRLRLRAGAGDPEAGQEGLGPPGSQVTEPGPTDMIHRGPLPFLKPGHKPLPAPCQPHSLEDARAGGQGRGSLRLLNIHLLPGSCALLSQVMF